MLGNVEHTGSWAPPRRPHRAAWRKTWFLCTGVAATALVATLAGCGSSAPTKHDFITRADAICASAIRQARAIPPPSDQPTAQALYLTQLASIAQSEATQLRALRRPTQSSRDGATLSRYMEALAAVVTAYRNLAGAAKRGDAEAVNAAEADLRASPIASLANSYGMTSCATPGPTSV
jgi:hypothetical protein